MLSFLKSGSVCGIVSTVSNYSKGHFLLFENGIQKTIICRTIYMFNINYMGLESVP